MLRFRRRRLLHAAACGLAGLVLDGPRTPTASAGPTARAEVDVVLLASAPQGDVTRVLRVAAGSTDVPAPLAAVHHRAGAAVRGATSPEGGVAVVADTAPDDDLSFAASLFHVAPGAGSAKLVAGRVVHASRPLFLPDGRIAVARGTADTTAAAGASREDELTIDSVAPATGEARTLLRTRGFLLFLVGVVDRTLLVYRLTKTGADLVAIDLATGAQTTVAKDLPPFARDFDVDPRGHRVVFVDRHPTDARRWQVLAIDLRTGASSTLTEGSSLALLPFVLDDGEVAANGPDRLARIGGAPIDLPLPGLFQLLARQRTGDSSDLGGLVTVPGQLGRPVLLRGDGSGASLVAAPKGERVTIAGLVRRGSR